MRKYRRVPYPSVLLREIVWRFRDVEELPVGFDRSEPVTSPDMMKRYAFLFEGYTTERFVVFILNSKNVVQAVEIVSEGTLNASLVHPREVYRSAVLGLGASKAETVSQAGRISRSPGSWWRPGRSSVSRFMTISSLQNGG